MLKPAATYDPKTDAFFPRIEAVEEGKVTGARIIRWGYKTRSQALKEAEEVIKTAKLKF